MKLNVSDKREFFGNAMKHPSGFFVSGHFLNNVEQRNCEDRLLDRLCGTGGNQLEELMQARHVV